MVSRPSGMATGRGCSGSWTPENGNPIDPALVGMPPDFPDEVCIVLTFRRVGDKTELTVIEHDWTVGEMRDLPEAGMGQSLDKLTEALPES